MTTKNHGSLPEIHSHPISWREKILQLNYLLVRTDNQDTLFSLSTLLRDILNGLQENVETGEISVGEYTECMIVLYKMTAYTRDLVAGKGEYTLAYMMIVVWNDFFPGLAKYALQCFVLSPEPYLLQPFGSWKDMKYFCDYCLEDNVRKNMDLILYAFSLLNKQLKLDEYAPTNKLSLAAKWVPREKSKRFGWIFHYLAKDYYPNCSEKKANRQYRRLLSRLNAELDTIQIKMCNYEWDTIDHTKTTSITLMKQSKALLNLNESASIERRLCANYLKKEILENEFNKTFMKGKHVSMSSFVERAIYLLEEEQNQAIQATQATQENQIQTFSYLKMLLNSQWKDYTFSLEDFSNPILPLIDTSLPREKLYEAIGMAIYLAEKSTPGRRVMTYSSIATWHNLDHCKDFTDRVKVIIENREKDWGLTPNLSYALDKITSVMTDCHMTQDEKATWTLVVFSPSSSPTITENMAPMKIVYWNMHSDDPFLKVSATMKERNMSILSGNQPSLLNVLNTGSHYTFERKEWMAWKQLRKLVDHERYKCMENKMKEWIL